MVDEMIADEISETKGCQYPGCENSLPASAEFEYCEVCRAITLRNSISILLDPMAPISDRAELFFARAIHLMRPDEVLNAVRKVEWIYLELNKQLKSAQLEIYRKQKFEEGMELARADREKPRAPKSTEKKVKTTTSKRAKLEAQFGVEGAKRLLNDNTDDDLGF